MIVLLHLDNFCRVWSHRNCPQTRLPIRVKRAFFTTACLTLSLMVGIPRGRFLPFGLGIITRLVGLGSVSFQLRTNFTRCAGCLLPPCQCPQSFYHHWFEWFVWQLVVDLRSLWALTSVGFVAYGSPQVVWHERFFDVDFSQPSLLVANLFGSNFLAVSFVRLLSFSWRYLTCHRIRFLVPFYLSYKTQMKSAIPFGQGQILNPYLIHYKSAFAF